MKGYLKPNVEIIITDAQDVVCASIPDMGMSVGNGGSDINNWNWGVAGASEERENLPT